MNAGGMQVLIAEKMGNERGVAQAKLEACRIQNRRRKS